MQTKKRCISCLQDFMSESPGDNGLGVCSECSRRLDEAQRQNKEMFEILLECNRVFS